MDTKNNLFKTLKILKWVAIGLAILILILIILFCWSLFTYDFASYNPIIELGGGYTYNEDNYVIEGPDIDVPPNSEVIYNCDEYFVVKQKPEEFDCAYYDWLYYYPYGRDTVYYWIIYKKEHRFVGPVLKDKYKAIVANKETDRFVGAFAKCGNEFQKDFVKRHGNDDYSIFKWSTFNLDEVRGDTAIIDADVIIRHSDNFYYFNINTYYSIQDSAVLKIDHKGTIIYDREYRTHSKNHGKDTEYLILISQKFMELGVSSLDMRSGGDVSIKLYERYGYSKLFKPHNNAIMRPCDDEGVYEYNKICYRKVSENWYAPI